MGACRPMEPITVTDTVEESVGEELESCTVPVCGFPIFSLAPPTRFSIFLSFCLFFLELCVFGHRTDNRKIGCESCLLRARFPFRSNVKGVFHIPFLRIKWILYTQAMVMAVALQ